MTSPTIFSNGNLDVLRGLNSEATDLVYLDPPPPQFGSPHPDQERDSARGVLDTWTLSDVGLAWLGGHR